MLQFLSAEQRASTAKCLDVEMTPSTTLARHWDCQVQVVDPDPAMAPVLPYLLPNATPELLAEELEKWSSAHGRDGPLPVFFRKADPQVLARITFRG